MTVSDQQNHRKRNHCVRIEISDSMRVEWVWRWTISYTDLWKIHFVTGRCLGVYSVGKSAIGEAAYFRHGKYLPSLMPSFTWALSSLSFNRPRTGQTILKSTEVRCTWSICLGGSAQLNSCLRRLLRGGWGWLCKLGQWERATHGQSLWVSLMARRLCLKFSKPFSPLASGHYWGED